MSRNDFNKLYQDNGIVKTGDFFLDVDLNVKAYIEHAYQDQENKIKIEDLLQKGIHDQKLTDFLFYKGGELYFKRNVYLIIGKNK